MKVFEGATTDPIGRGAAIEAVMELKESVIQDHDDEIYNMALDHAINALKHHVKSVYVPNNCNECGYKELAILHCMVAELNDEGA